MIELKGFEKLEKKLDKFSNLQTGEFLLSVANSVKNEVAMAFENERSPFGKKWKELSESTKQRRLKGGKKAKKTPIILKLYDTGDLRSKWAIARKGKNAVIISSNAKKDDFAYGLVHQFGTNKAGRKKNVSIQARPFLPIKGKNISKSLKTAIREHKKEILKELK